MDLCTSGYALSLGYGADDHKLRYSFMNWLIKRMVRNGDMLADIGCVDGGRSVLFTELCGDKGKVIGIDISKKYLEARIKNTKVEYIRCDWNKIPLKDESVDVVIHDNGLEHSTEPLTTLCEIWRICKREVVFGVPHAPDILLGNLIAGHVKEFTHDSIVELVGKKFHVIESYYIKNAYGGYNWIVIRGIKNLQMLNRF